jgi:hypothetical protein
MQQADRSARCCKNAAAGTVAAVVHKIRIAQLNLTHLINMQVLPADIREPLVQHPQRASLLEVVLDLGRRPEARFLGQAGGQFLRDAEVGERAKRWVWICSNA